MLKGNEIEGGEKRPRVGVEKDDEEGDE